MAELYIIFGLAMVVNISVVYISIGIALLEFKGIELPLIKYLKWKDEVVRKYMIMDVSQDETIENMREKIAGKGLRAVIEEQCGIEKTIELKEVENG